MRETYSSGSPWENVVGYSRAVKVGNILEISGTLSASEDGIVGKGDIYEQTHYILFEKVDAVLKKAGFTKENVVRTRLFVTDISKWEYVAKAHSEYFDAVRPACTMVEVKALIVPEYMIEIEVTAIKG